MDELKKIAYFLKGLIQTVIFRDCFAVKEQEQSTTDKEEG